MHSLSGTLVTLVWVWIVGLPVLAILTGFTERGKWLTVASLSGLAILVWFLIIYAGEIDTGQVPNATGMEGLVLLFLPPIYLGSVLLAVLIHTIIHLWRRRR